MFDKLAHFFFGKILSVLLPLLCSLEFLIFFFHVDQFTSVGSELILKDFVNHFKLGDIVQVVVFQAF